MTESFWLRMKKKFIGDKAFYKMVLTIAVPMIIQNGISNFVSMLDNIMVGRIGTLEMSGVSIVNQLNFVYMLCIFGGIGGIGIFTAQYFGASNEEGVRNTFRVKLWMGLLVSAAGVLIFLFFGETLIRFYLNEEASNLLDIEKTLSFAETYLKILLLSFPAFFLLQVYSSMLRETGETVVPMKAGILSVVINLTGNFLLIFGLLGFPKLGVAGAAIATVLARYAEMLYVVIWTHTHRNRQPWIAGAYRTLFVPIREAGRYLAKGLPLFVNETLWSTGQAVLAQCYSVRGLSAVAGINIANTLNNFLDIIFITLANSIGIIVGQALGAGRLEEAKDRDNKMLAFAFFVSLISAALILLGSLFFPNFYNTTTEVKTIASSFLIAYAFTCPKNAFLQGAYMTLRAGGRTIRTLIFDSGSVWGVSIPIAFLLSRFTGLSAVMIFACVAVADLSKVALGYVWVRKNIWLVNMVRKDDPLLPAGNERIKRKSV